MRRVLISLGVIAALIIGLAGPATAQTPTPTPTYPVVAPLTDARSSDFGATDPYICGDGFYGSIAGGVAPYNVSYVLAGPATTNLPGFAVAAAGPYISPAPYVNYATQPFGTYTVVYTIRDSSPVPQSVSGSFSANITNVCTPAPTPTARVVIVPGTPIVVPGTPIVVPGTPIVVVATPTPDFGFRTGIPTMPAPPAAKPPLAVTGSSSATTVMLATGLIGLGGLFLLVVRKRQAVATR